MAKPGSNGARRIAGGARAVDLTIKTISDEEARRVQEMLEHKLGARCNGCGRRITMGLKFTSLDPRDTQPVITMSACNRQDCDFAETCRPGATFMEMIEFAWLDENGPDAPASVSVVKRNEELARLAAAAPEKTSE
jgi:hypothetical protein